MKSFKQLRTELSEQDYGSAWERVKSGATQIGAGAAEAGKTFVKRDLPVLIKKGEQAYQKTIKPAAKKVAGAVGGAMETGGQELKKMATEDFSLPSIDKKPLLNKPFKYDPNKPKQELVGKPSTYNPKETKSPTPIKK